MRGTGRRGARIAAACGAIAAAGVAAPQAVAAVSDSEAVAKLNAQRTLHGIPGQLALDPKMTEGCDKHNNYIRLNGDRLTHGEQEGNPGWTPEGSRQRAEYDGAEVLAKDPGVWDTRFKQPWHQAPIHLLAVFNPMNVAAGYADSHGTRCMRFVRSFDDPPQGVFTIPGPGVTGVPTVTDSRGEGPYSPADAAGVSDQAGYNILVMRPAGTLNIVDAKLQGPKGAVDIRVVDPRTPAPFGGTFNWGGSVIVPPKPLAPKARHVLDIVFEDGLAHHLEFTTAAAPVKLRDQSLRFRIRRGGPLTILAGKTPGVKRTATVRFHDRRGRTIGKRRVRLAKTVRVALPRNAVYVTVSAPKVKNYKALFAGPVRVG